MDVLVVNFTCLFETDCASWIDDVMGCNAVSVALTWSHRLSRIARMLLERSSLGSSRMFTRCNSGRVQTGEIVACLQAWVVFVSITVGRLASWQHVTRDAL